MKTIAATQMKRWAAGFAALVAVITWLLDARWRAEERTPFEEDDR